MKKKVSISSGSVEPDIDAKQQRLKQNRNGNSGIMEEMAG